MRGPPSSALFSLGAPLAQQYPLPSSDQTHGVSLGIWAPPLQLYSSHNSGPPQDTEQRKMGIILTLFRLQGLFSDFLSRKPGFWSILIAGMLATTLSWGLTGDTPWKRGNKNPQQALASRSSFFPGLSWVFFYFIGFSSLSSGLTCQRSHPNSSAGCLLLAQGQERKEGKWEMHSWMSLFSRFDSSPQ